MLKITFACFHCQNPMTVEAEHGGKRGRCPKCGSEFAIPSLEGSAPGEPGAPPTPISPSPEILAETSRLKKALVEAGARTAAAERLAAERDSEARRQVAEGEREIERLGKEMEELRSTAGARMAPGEAEGAKPPRGGAEAR
ncbi:MAG: hypothetical protein HY720_09810, partial [Planctomycetes bacterium]|nr:hypothetical protein [Planctomycetota bacterium]